MNTQKPRKGKTTPKKVREVVAEHLMDSDVDSVPGMPRVIGIRELKAHASEVLRGLEESGQGVIITRHGMPWGRLMPFPPPEEQKRRASQRGSLRNAYPDLPDIPEEAFHEVKQAWVKGIEGVGDGHNY